MYGAQLVKRLPEFEWVGITGSNLEKLNVKSIENIENISVVGLTEVIPKYRNIKIALKKAIEELDKGVDLLIVIDFPGFNLKLLKEAKKRGIKTVYFIAPQVWAWGKGRVSKIVENTDLLISIFPFEKNFYKEYIGKNFKFLYLGHPLLDIVKTKETEDSFKNKLGINKSRKIFGLLAGSRESEVKVLLPILLKTASLLHKVEKSLYFVIPSTDNQLKNVLSVVKNFSKLPVKVITKKDFTYPSYEVMEKSVFSLIASGTATLEASIIGKPFALVYKVSPLTFWIGKKLVSVKYLGLPNIISGKEVIKEFLQEDCNPVNLANYSLKVLSNSDIYLELQENLKTVKSKLGEKGTLDRVANAIRKFSKVK
ncbi:MAG TPA: lipid-A-disaccharide synthase [Persephonella sp.]|nr:lipid-A-disaccharide synthase [Hydrogenothermaceae bacterium]HIQ25646.1 lipid-A-disaccharide synthase [Persephonella sp.]